MKYKYEIWKKTELGESTNFMIVRREISWIFSGKLTGLDDDNRWNEDMDWATKYPKKFSSLEEAQKVIEKLEAKRSNDWEKVSDEEIAFKQLKK